MRYYKRNTMNLISVILSIFIVMGVMVMVPGAYSSPVGSYSVILGAFFVLMPLVNALFQNLVMRKVYDPSKYFFTLAFNESVGYEWLVCGSAIVLLFFLPSTDLRPIGFANAAIVVAIWVAIAALTIFISQKFTKVDFLNDTILVKGLNFFKAPGCHRKPQQA